MCIEFKILKNYRMNMEDYLEKMRNIYFFLIQYLQNDSFNGEFQDIINIFNKYFIQTDKNIFREILINHHLFPTKFK